MATVMYRQYLLERDGCQQHAWLPSTKVKVGKFVEIRGDDSGPWEIKNEWETEMTEEEVKAKGDLGKPGAWTKLANV